MNNSKIEINNTNLIDEILETAIIVFNPTKEEVEKFLQKEMWLEKIASGGVSVL